MADDNQETPAQLRRRRLAEIAKLPPGRRIQALRELAAELAKHETELKQEEATTQEDASETEHLAKKSEEEVATLERLLPKQEFVKAEDVLKVAQAEAKKAEEKMLEEHVREAVKESPSAAAAGAKPAERQYAELHQRTNEELYARFKDLREQLRETQYKSGEQAPAEEQRRIVYEMQRIGHEAHYRGMQEQQMQAAQGMQGQGMQAEQHFRQSGMMSALEEWASRYHT